MGTKQAKELRELNDTELEHRLGETKEELFYLRFQSATGQLDNVARKFPTAALATRGGRA